MPSLHVCPLSRLEEIITATGADHLVTLLKADHAFSRPPQIAPSRHLWLPFNDITEPREGLTLVQESHVRQLLDFVAVWPREKPLIIHCWAGISRSPAAAFVIACALDPQQDETILARLLRHAAPSATPNARLVALGDALLSRDGRMIKAVSALGRGCEAPEGEPFQMLPVSHRNAE
jgi:predicted protein tyrosine phosphatase